MAGRVGVQVPVGDPQALREGKLRRPQASVPCTSAVTLFELKAGPLPDTPVKTPRDHPGAMKGREGKLRSGFDLGGRGRKPRQGKCLLEPTAVAEAGGQEQGGFRSDWSRAWGGRVQGRQPVPALYMYTAVLTDLPGLPLPCAQLNIGFC